jgi:hypothetical protein
MNFDALWREAGERERREADGPWKLRLQCDGEFVDLGSVRPVGLCQSDLGLELIQFVCPRCGRRHESPRFK